jgi:orc1/cdc6 family replication initiation protein
MGLYDNILMEGESIFRNEDVLDFEWLPPVLPHRETQVEYIAEVTKPLFTGRKPQNLFISGAPGIGKTTSVRFVLKELKESSDNIVPIYVNCWKCSTNHSIFLEIARQINLPFPNKGVSTESIAESVFSKLNRWKGVVLAFDEIDKAEDTDFLYKVLESLGKKACVIMTTNNKEFLIELDGRLKSRLAPESMHFKKYSYSEIKDILLDRVKHSFVPGAFNNEMIDIIAKKTEEIGDIRTGMFLLQKAGRFAEKDAAKKIDESHIKKAIETLTEFTKKTNMENLSDLQAKIYALIKKNPGKISGEYHNILKKEGTDISSRYFRSNIKHLEDSGLIRTRDTGKGFIGRSRIIEPYGDNL